MPDLQKLHDAILDGDAKTAAAVTREALDGGTDPLDLVTKYMVPAMDEVGRRFECEEYFVPELLLAARAMKGALELIRPLLGFNLGVEAGQLLVVAPLLPVALWLMRRPALHRRVRIVCGVGVGVLATIWLVQRVVAA